MEKTPADRAYLKKHKLNDLFNDLYVSILKEKPENPFEYIVNKLQSKLVARNSSAIEPNQILGSLSDHIQNSPLRRIQVFNNIKRILVSQTTEITEEELLKQENIDPYTRKYEENNDKESVEIKIDEIQMKKICKNRQEVSRNNRVELKKLIENVQHEQNKHVLEDAKEQESVYDSPLNDVEFDEESNEDYKPHKNKVKKSAVRESNLVRPLLNQALVRTIICKMCSKVQNDSIKDKDMLKIEAKSVRSTTPKNPGDVELPFSINSLKQTFTSLNAIRQSNDIDVESASQVSGPRGPLDKFEVKTSRSEIHDVTNVTHAHDSIMSWVLARQNAPKETLSASFINSDSTQTDRDESVRSRQTPLWHMIQSDDEDENKGVSSD